VSPTVQIERAFGSQYGATFGKQSLSEPHGIPSPTRGSHVNAVAPAPGAQRSALTQGAVVGVHACPWVAAGTQAYAVVG
jgi:hypothetical protein